MIGLLIAATLIGAYLLGSIPTAYIVAKFRKGTDIRDVGSKNMGGMNVVYNVGFWWGILTIAVDISKGVLAMAIAHWFKHAFGLPVPAYFATGIAVMLGHNFPIFLKFRGGKGGATAVGILCYILPWGCLIGVTIFGILMLITRFPTLSYGIGLLCFPFVAWLIYHRVDWIVFSVIVIAIPFVRYIPRVREIYQKAGNVRHALQRKNLKDRF